MADPTTTNILLSIPTHGSNTDTWDVPVNGDFTALDGYMGGVQTISVSSTNVTLTAPAGAPTPAPGPTQAQNAVLRFTGTLTANLSIILPLPGIYVAENFTTGNFALSMVAQTPGGGEFVCLEPGATTRVYCDGTHVRFIGLPPVGSYLDICDASVPLWIAASSKPPYLLCDGGTFSSATYPYLAAKLGGTTLPDFRGRSSFYLNSGTGRLTAAGAGIDGDTRFSAGGNNGVLLAANQVPSLTSSAVNSINVNTGGIGGGYFPVTANSSVGIGSNAAPGGGGFISPYPIVNSSWLQINSLTTANSITVSYSNGAQQIIKSTTPGAVSGIRLIRAA